MIWIFILFLILVLAWLADRNVLNGKKIYLLALILVLSYIVGFWGPSAQDHPGYADKFNSYKEFSQLSGYNGGMQSRENNTEIAYAFINILANKLGLGEAGFFFLIAFFVNTVIIVYVYKHHQPVLALFYLFATGFFFQEANLVRQYIAAAIFILAIPFLMDRKYLKYSLLILLASLFHTSSIILFVFLVFFFDKNEKVEKYMRYGISALWIGSVLITFRLISIDLLKIVSSFDYYSVYASDDNAIGMEFGTASMLIYNVLSVFAIFYTFNRYKLMSSILIISSVIMNISVVYPNISRMIYFFAAINAVYIVQLTVNKIYKTSLARRLSSVANVMIVCFCVFRFLTAVAFNPDNKFGTITYSLSDFFK